MEDQTFCVQQTKCARAVTKWIRACDKRLTRLISNLQYTSEYRQQCHVGNTAQQCRLGLFQDSYSAGDLEDAKLTSRRILCILNYAMTILSSNVKSSQFGAMPYISEDNEAVIKMSLKGGSPTMRHFSRTRTVALDCQLTESILIRRFKSNMLTPNTTSQTYGQRATSHLMSETIFSICVTTAILVQFAALRISALRVAQNDVEKDATRNTLRQAFLQRRVRVHQIVW